VRPRSKTGADLQPPTTATPASVDLLWLPLGAGGRFVAFNGRLYEFIQARREHRRPLDLYHTALEVSVPEGRFVIESAWPIPDSHPEERGVTIQGPVWSPYLGRFRTFRNEIRCWRDGSIADFEEAVASPQRVTDDLNQARAVLATTKIVPSYVWGRDQLHIGEMWNSNSVISWILTVAGISASDVRPPAGGRVPGWITGVLAAENSNPRFTHPGLPVTTG